MLGFGVAFTGFLLLVLLGVLSPAVLAFYGFIILGYVDDLDDAVDAEEEF